MSNTRLVDYLQQNDIITKDQADQVRVGLSTTNQNEEQLLREKTDVNAEAVAKAKSEIFNIPYVNLREVNVDEGVFSSIATEKLKKYNAVPYQIAGHVIKVGMSDPFDIQAIQALESALKGKHGGRLLVHIATQDAVDFVLDSNMGGMISSEVSEAVEEFDTPVAEIDTSGGASFDTAGLSNAPVARIVNSIFEYAIKSKASDIHIEPQETRLRVRFRIDGVMDEKLVLPRKMKSSVVARIKIMSNLKIDEKRVPQDGRIQIKTDTTKFDVRVSTLPTIFGEKVVMRLLDNSEGVPPLETTGLRGSGWNTYVDAIDATNGIILITGPTGSGKTRTQAATLSRLNNPKVNIITLENPVEIKIPGVTQVQINPDVGLTYASTLRSVLRQDPDIVMVGEIRDQETAGLAVEASLTGHIVLATIHTNSAVATIPRLVDMGIEPYLLASTLRVAVAQRLPRRICRHCMEAYEAKPETVQSIVSIFSNLQGFDPINYLQQLSQSANQEGVPEHLSSIVPPEIDESGNAKLYLYRGKGCSRCGQTGYKGRIGIFEVMRYTEEMGEKTIANSSEDVLNNLAIEQGMITILQDGHLKAIEGLTTLEEVLRVSKI